jgi:tungstate transport system substrate-binding protein
MHRPLGALRRSIVLAATAVALLAPLARAQRRAEITLATTTSTQDTGLLDSLLPMFRQETGIDVKPIAVGTGAALDMARRGDADAVLVHAPEAEAPYVQSGDLIGGRLIMHNDFLILGPDSDPAHVRRAQGLVAQMRAIAAGGAFVSRGDGSGTEKKELALWKAAGVSPASIPRREETGQGMGATLLVADARQTYTLTDRGTYLAFKDRLTLVPLVEGDTVMRNIYHAYVVNPGKHPTVRRSDAERFVRFLADPKVQAWIGRFGQAKFGQPLFVPDAAVKSAALDRRAS